MAVLVLLGDSFSAAIHRGELPLCPSTPAALLGCSVMLGAVGLQGAAKARMVGYVPLYLAASPRELA